MHTLSGWERDLNKIEYFVDSEWPRCVRAVKQSCTTTFTVYLKTHTTLSLTYSFHVPQVQQNYRSAFAIFFQAAPRPDSLNSRLRRYEIYQRLSTRKKHCCSFYAPPHYQTIFKNICSQTITVGRCGRLIWATLLHSFIYGTVWYMDKFC